MLEYIAGIIAVTIMIYVFGELSKVERPNEGYMFTVYPWLTTAPETISTVLYALKGYYTTAVYNSVFSATFDVMVAFGLSTLIHGEADFKLEDLAFITVFAGAIFGFLIHDGAITYVDGFVLLAVLFVAMIYSVYTYGWVGVKLSGFDVVRIITGLMGLGFLSYALVGFVEGLIPFLGQDIAGVVSACATSIPDLVVAIVYGMRSSYAQAEILGCIIHDVTENIAIASIIAGAVFDANPLVTIAILCATIYMLAIIPTYVRITRFEAFLAVVTFLVCTLLVVIW